MIKRIVTALAVMALGLTFAAPANASVPEWDKIVAGGVEWESEPATVALAAPVHAASSYNGCADNGGTNGDSQGATAVCLYNWVDWEKGGGFWRRTFYEMESYSRDCASLQNHYWDIGGTVYDDPPSSFVSHQRGGSDRVIRLYDWVGCNAAGGYVNMFVPSGGLSQDNNLSTTVPANNGSAYYDPNWYNRTSSIQLCDFISGSVVCD